MISKTLPMSNTDEQLHCEKLLCTAATGDSFPHQHPSNLHKLVGKRYVFPPCCKDYGLASRDRNLCFMLLIKIKVEI